MSDEERATCSRTGCGKRLRASNTKGVCGSGCRSMEAPVYQRAPELRDGAPVAKRAKKAEEPEPGALSRFRVVAEALGKDPDALVEEFASAWLETLKERLEES